MRSHQMLLANASHELRTPLDAHPHGARDVEETPIRSSARGSRPTSPSSTQLIEEILLASRLDAVRAPERSEEVDLLALAAEEARARRRRASRAERSRCAASARCCAGWSAT